MIELDDLLTADQAAEYLGVTRQRIYVLTKAGRIGRRIGSTWLFTRGELEAFKQQPRSKGGRPKAVAGTLTPARPV